MRIDGRQIAENLLAGFTEETARLKIKGVIPQLAVVLAGEDPGSISYIRQKRKTAEMIGASVIVNTLPSTISAQKLEEILVKFSNDPAVHGLILQRPLPPELAGQTEEIVSRIGLAKDIDGFLAGSPYPAPVALAVWMILQNAFERLYRPFFRQGIGTADSSNQKACEAEKFLQWISSQNIVVIGRGETAGKPIAKFLSQKGLDRRVVHSQTVGAERITGMADIIISCVGRANVVRRVNVKKGVGLISVGLYRTPDGRLAGDYDEAEIADYAGWYTPTPGGVGPVNVACLMQNLIEAAKRQIRM